MNIKVEKGNLFELDNKYALCHCISLDAAMGAGIATQFKNKFSGIQSYIRNEIISNDLNYPVNVNYYKNGRIIINLITKNKYWNKPTYKTIEKCIEDMARYCKDNNIKYLGMPKIGCGLDRLQWNKVRNIIENKFEDMDVDIIVRYIR